MNVNFFRKFYELLIENEFQLLRDFYDKPVIDENSMFVGVYKQIGNMFYVIMPINADKVYNGYTYTHIQLKYFEYIKSLYNNNDIGNIVFLNILMSENVTEELIRSSKITETDYMVSDILSVCWVVDTTKNKIFINDGQPDKILNIQELLKQCFSDGNIFFEDSTTVFNVIKDKKIKEKNSLKSKDTFLTYTFILINLVILVLMELNGGSTNDSILISFGALVPEKVIVEHQYYRLFTAMFLHIGIEHFVANTLSLYIFGTRIERSFGKVFFAAIYLFSGLACSFVSLLFQQNTNIISAGASGAIFGLMGAAFMFALIKKKSIDGFNLYLISIFIILNLCFGAIIPNVDNFGHIGGLLGGIFITFILKRFWK